MIMPLGNFTEELSRMQDRKPAASHIFMSTLFYKRDMILTIINMMTKVI